MQFQPILTRFLAEEAREVLDTSLEAGFSHLPHKPALLYNVRKNTRTNPLWRMHRECEALAQLAFDPKTLRNSLSYLSLQIGVQSGIVVIGDPREAHLREVRAECSANYLQSVAARTDKLEDHRAALNAGLLEQQELEQANAAQMVRIAELVGLAATARRRIGGAA